ncbi:MAG: ankyrin repeat domain-containing protein [Thermoleophilia bacterium]|nr:ankyrin repeat domain-containing protein [Thermoleophilia bacterium]
MAAKPVPDDELLEAIRRGDAATVRRVVADDPAAARARDEMGVSAVLLARYRGAQDVVDAVLEAGPELDVFDAAALGPADRLAGHLDAEPSLANAWSSDGFTPLHLAAFFGHEAGVAVLLERGANVEAVSRNALRARPLNSAAAAGERAICERLLVHGADPSAPSEGGFTPLHAAAQTGDAELVRLLLEHGADAEATSADGHRPLDFAREGGHDAAATLLEERLGA